MKLKTILLEPARVADPHQNVAAEQRTPPAPLELEAAMSPRPPGLRLEGWLSARSSVLSCHCACHPPKGSTPADVPNVYLIPVPHAVLSLNATD